MQETILTDDLWLASFMKSKGAELNFNSKQERIIFELTGDNLNNLRGQFYDGGSINILTFKGNYLSLKHKIYNLKKNKI